MNRRSLFEQVNQTDLVDYLEKLGHFPQKIKGDDYWYLSPLRKEKTASFKVNRRMNAWYDHGIGKGGGIIDFGKLYYNCSLVELLSKLDEQKAISVSDLENNIRYNEKKKNANIDHRINILSTHEISNPKLISYLESRKIPIGIAKQFSEQVQFEVNSKIHLAIGFKNNSGGYELRNDYFKGSSSPKEPRLIQHRDNNSLQVFEGFFSFLSFETMRQTMKQDSAENPIDLSKFTGDNLVLNSLSFFQRIRPTMEKYETIHLFLDRDAAGIQNTAKAIQWSPKYIDQSFRYKHHKDLNDYLTNQPKQEIKQSRRRGLGL